MSAITLNILKPSVNNLTVRIFVRAAGLDFDEVDVWGQTGTPEFLAKDPAHLTPMIEEEGLPRGTLWESCAIMQYLCNTHGLEQFYPAAPGERAMVDSAMFYLIGTLFRSSPARPTRRSPSRTTRARSAPRTPTMRPRRSRSRRVRLRSRNRSTCIARSSSTASGSSEARHPRSPTSDSLRRSSSCARSTTTSRPGRRSTSPGSRNRSERPTQCPWRTSAGTSTT